MRAFMIDKGVQARAIKDTVLDWQMQNYKTITTSDDLMFFIEDMRIDPTGIAKHASTPANRVTIGGHWASQGYYGFERKGWVLLVHHSQVTVG